MPWIDSKKIAPPINTDIMIRNDDGTSVIRKLEDVEVYNGLGGFRDTMPRYWQQPNGDPLSSLPETDIGVDGISCQEHHVDIKPTFDKDGL